MVFFVVRYLSPQRIEYAKQFENNKLHFDINDMRENINTKFDGVFSLSQVLDISKMTTMKSQF
jgi:hypothetical protein